MEDLIKQAFLHVDVIGPHVQEGHFDLIGPDNEIILPQVWEKVVQPDWSITMHMWPMDKAPLMRPGMPPGPIPVGGGPHHRSHRPHGPHGVPMAGVPPPHARMGRPPGSAPAPPPAWMNPQMMGAMPRPMQNPNIMNVDESRAERAAGKKKAKSSGFLGGFFGGPPPKAQKKR